MDGLGTAQLSKAGKVALMETEERNVGAVSWDVYLKYLRNGGGLFWLPIILCLLLLNEAGNGIYVLISGNFQRLIILSLVGITLFLGFWTENSIPHFKNGHYMAVYAGIGSLLCHVYAR